MQKYRKEGEITLTKKQEKITPTKKAGKIYYDLFFFKNSSLKVYRKS